MNSFKFIRARQKSVHAIALALNIPYTGFTIARWQGADVADPRRSTALIQRDAQHIDREAITHFCPDNIDRPGYRTSRLLHAPVAGGIGT